MPLLKLWNTIRGKSPENPVADTAAKKLSHATGGKSPRAKAAKASPEKPKLSLLDRFSGGPHAAICRLVRKSGAKTVLEIGVGDGERALAMTAALMDSSTNETDT